MSQRLGMSDGRCFTIYTNSNLLNDAIMSAGVMMPEDNYSYRTVLKEDGHKILESMVSFQTSEQRTPNSVSCLSCNRPLLKVTTPY